MKLLEEAKKIGWMKKMDEDEHSPSVFYYPKDLETFDSETKTGTTECHIINYLLT